MADFRLRIMFAKKDAALWLSHLEVVRSMERLIRRSGLPYAISQGFSPHLKHSFSIALPVGTGSAGEYMDVELEQLVNPKEALLALQKVEHPSLPVLDAWYAAKEEPSLQVYYNRATYEIVLDAVSSPTAAELVERLKKTEEVEILKKGKPKQYEVAQYLDLCELTGTHSLSVTMLNRPEGSLRPEVLLKAVAEPDLTCNITSLTRTMLEHKEL